MSTVRAALTLRHSRTRIALLAAVFLTSLSGISAHVVRGLYGTAFVSSPTPSNDQPIKITWTGTQGVVDTGLRVVCFNAANTSAPRPDAPDWPRITGVGLELPDARTGFALIEPRDGRWDIVEGVEQLIPGRGAVTLDFAVVARVNPLGFWQKRHRELPGIAPGQPAERGKGTRFCVSGPFPDTLPDPLDASRSVTTLIEGLLNGVVVRFHGVQPHGPSTDVGLWDNGLRTVPLYPE
jgi:hypothetical protein